MNKTNRVPYMMIVGTMLVTLIVSVLVAKISHLSPMDWLLGLVYGTMMLTVLRSDPLERLSVRMKVLFAASIVAFGSVLLLKAVQQYLA
jgi:hypothetical protein